LTRYILSGASRHGNRLAGPGETPKLHEQPARQIESHRKGTAGSSQVNALAGGNLKFTLTQLGCLREINSQNFNKI
jgi:hypothetical protein